MPRSFVTRSELKVEGEEEEEARMLVVAVLVEIEVKAAAAAAEEEEEVDEEDGGMLLASQCAEACRLVKRAVLSQQHARGKPLGRT
jgi:hypothetical protein